MDNKTQIKDKNGTILKEGDVVHNKWGYDLIVSIDENNIYYGKLVCEKGDSCENIPYSLIEEEIEKLPPHTDPMFKDLCSRLPYKVKLQGTDMDGDTYITTLAEIDAHNEIIWSFDEDGSLGKWDIEDVRPYLRPMSDMTEREKKEYNDFVFIDTADIFDWLNAHYIDYRGLIEIGLALTAPEGMYEEVS